MSTANTETEPRITVPSTGDEAVEILRGIDIVLNSDTFKMTPEARLDLEIRFAMVEAAFELLHEDVEDEATIIEEIVSEIEATEHAD